MAILYIYDKFPTTYQKYLTNLLRSIQERETVKTLVYTQDEKADYSVKRYGFWDFFQNLKFKLRFSKFKSVDLKHYFKHDIIHVQHSYLWRKLEVLKEFEKHPKIIVTLRGGDTYVKPWVDSSWQHFYQNSEHITAFVVMSNHQKAYLHEKWEVPLSKIQVIPISFGYKSNAQAKYPNTDKLRLVSAFRMTWEKNLQGAIQIAKLLKEQNVNFEFDIYGDGNDLGELYYLIDRYDLKDNVFPKGKIDNDALKNRLAAYDFFVQLSLSESLGMSVVEAQSVGVPCIVSNSGGLPEAVLHNETGVVLNYDDYQGFVRELLKLRNDKEQYFAFSKRAIEFVNSEFSVEEETKRLIDLYSKINSN